MVSALQPGRLSVGTAALGGMYATVDEGDALGTLQEAGKYGVTHFDTAPHYGRGLAEERLGRFLRGVGQSERFTISTKVGRRVHRTDTRSDHDIFLGAPPGESVFDFTPEAIREELDESRVRLGREHIDIALIHDPDEHLDEALAAAEELTRQRDSGRIGAIGVGTNSADVVHHLLDRIALDVVLLAGRITLLETSGESVAARCATEEITLFAAGVFQSGILAGGYGGSCDYAPASERTRRQVEELAAECAGHGVRLHQVAINHPRRFEGVTSTLVGVRSPEELVAAVDAISVDLPDELWTAIDAVRARHSSEGGHNTQQHSSSVENSRTQSHGASR